MHNRIRAMCAIIMGMTFLVMNLSIVRGKTSLQQLKNLKKSRDSLKSTIEDLKVQNVKLEGEILKIKSSKTYAEKILRDKYHYIEAHEQIVFFAD